MSILSKLHKSKPRGYFVIPPFALAVHKYFLGLFLRYHFMSRSFATGLTSHSGRQAARLFEVKGLFVGSRLDFEWSSAPNLAGLARPERANSLTRDSISFVHFNRTAHL